MYHVGQLQGQLHGPDSDEILFMGLWSLSKWAVSLCICNIVDDISELSACIAAASSRSCSCRCRYGRSIFKILSRMEKHVVQNQIFLHFLTVD
jgi:hypothetical protein